jgi:hypothetical protein
MAEIIALLFVIGLAIQLSGVFDETTKKKKNWSCVFVDSLETASKRLNFDLRSFILYENDRDSKAVTGTTFHDRNLGFSWSIDVYFFIENGRMVVEFNRSLLSQKQADNFRQLRLAPLQRSGVPIFWLFMIPKAGDYVSGEEITRSIEKIVELYPTAPDQIVTRLGKATLFPAIKTE